MENVLSLAELQSDLLALIDRAGKFAFHNTREVFQFLYETGFRIEELAEITNWTIESNGTVMCPTSKGSLPRTLTVDELPTKVLKSIEDGENYFYIQSYSSYQRNFEKCKIRYQYKVKTKKISTHLFRHHYVKQLNELGYNEQMIRGKMGIVAARTVQNYLNSELYYV